MTLQTSGPGKTSPKLYKDFLLFDPKAARPNILLELPPPQGEGPQLAPHIHSCRHEYTIKSNQSIAPPLELRPDGSTRYKLAVVCKSCRIHCDVKIDYGQSSNPCPTNEHPVHHFQPAKEHTAPTPNRITYDWQCSVFECGARLSITYRLPRTEDADLALLTQSDRLKRRYDECREQDPAREGVRRSTEMDAVSRLRRYIKDSLDPKHVRRQFAANNKRFQESFGIEGRDCRQLFESLGFKYASSDETDLEVGSWHLPDPEPVADRWAADGSSHREQLEDVEMELFGTMFRISALTGVVMPTPEIWALADQDVERTLAALGYQHHSGLRRPSPEEIPFFSSLGALSDFADSLVEYAYDRQTACDPGRTAYYFECLQVITQGRQSESLQVKVAMLESQNTVARRDVNAAFSAFNIAPLERNTISDQIILDRFQAAIPDQGQAAQQRSREHLYKLGCYRQSTLLLNASRQSVDTYEDALTWLGNGVTQETSDESLTAVLALKVDAHAPDMEIGRKAIATIAEARQSSFLKDWLVTGDQQSNIMAVDEALRHLDITAKLEELDPTLIPAIFDSARQDRPGDVTERAIATISEALRGQKGSAGGASGTGHPPAEWPVGLISHGNTCYLNSILQYYFSLQPVRDTVLNYEKYQLDTTTQAEKAELVGYTPVSSVVIKGGQRFARDLSQLFDRMIHDSGSGVRPEDDLVCRAFLHPSDYGLMGTEEDNADKSEKDTSKSLDAIAEGNEDANENGAASAEPSDTRATSESSATTLVGDGDVDMVNGDAQLTPPTSDEGSSEAQNPEPEHKPPLPPRNALRRMSAVRGEALDKAKSEATRQQDVAEVHDGMMFRLRAGMKAEGQEEASREQQDPLRDIFRFTYAETKIEDGAKKDTELRVDTAITFNVPLEDTDIYSELDKILDLSEGGSGESYKTFKSLPPFLQLATPRIAFDREKGAYKADSTLRLEEEIYLDRYIDDSHPTTLTRRQECWAWRKQLNALREERTRLTDTGLDVNSPTAFLHTAEYLASLDGVNAQLEEIGSDRIEADGDITADLAQTGRAQAARLTELDSDISALESLISKQFKYLKKVKYLLAAVFFHRGTTGGGHYWVDIKDFDKGMWRKYSDETVEKISSTDVESKVLNAKGYWNGTPTYVVYVSEDHKKDVQPLCRDPEEPPVAEVQEMDTSGWPAEQGAGLQRVDSGQQQHQGSKPRSQAEAMKGVDPSLVPDQRTGTWDDAERLVDGSAAW